MVSLSGKLAASKCSPIVTVRQQPLTSLKIRTVYSSTKGTVSADFRPQIFCTYTLVTLVSTSRFMPWSNFEHYFKCIPGQVGHM